MLRVQVQSQREVKEDERRQVVGCYQSRGTGRLKKIDRQRVEGYEGRGRAKQRVDGREVFDVNWRKGKN